MKYDSGGCYVARRIFLGVITVVFLSSVGCSSPPLSIYTFGSPSITLPSNTGNASAFLSIEKIRVPDYLDNNDILVRDADRVIRSFQGRMASRLSVLSTDYIARLLAQKRPDLTVSSVEGRFSNPYRLFIILTQFDIQTNGYGELQANWNLVASNNENQSVQKGKYIIRIHGDTSSDAGIIAMEKSLLKKLAESIDLTLIPGSG